MTYKKFIKIAIFICFVIFLKSICQAETYYQKDKLYSIDVPEGWSASEKQGAVRITNPKGDNGISIQFKATPVTQKEVVMQSSINTRIMAKAIVEMLKGTVKEEKATSVDGVYARRLDYMMTLSGQTANVTYILVINADKGYAFAISFGSPSKNEKAKMENAVKTFKFQ